MITMPEQGQSFFPLLFYYFRENNLSGIEVGLSIKQIKYIEKNRSKLSVSKLAENLNLNPEEVKKYLDENPSAKTPHYFYLIMILIPILFFVLLEFSLRIFNYGYDLSMWGNVIEGKLILNPDAPRRYFTTVKSTPSSIEDIFDEEKSPNSFRVFVLGGSSAAGYPYMPMGPFSRYIRKRLELNYPDKKIEVVNIALSAISTFTVRDFIPEVLEQKPDLILIYAGHNEYYGALGVGSQESVGSSRELINILLYLNKYKTTQLVKDFLQWLFGMVDTEGSVSATGTLMSRMAKEKEIEINSGKYQSGIDQFEGNMNDIIQMIKEKNVPLIISTLASNLKDQPPFISISNGSYPPADKIFEEAEKEYASGKYIKADSLYRFAKDLDGLRFRAPEKINGIIKNLGKLNSVPVIDADSLFASLSINGITGNNLMTDHLHPTLDGFKELGRLFYEEMDRRNYVPADSKPAIEFARQDEITKQNFVFSEFDSVVAEYRIKLLRNDWPFIDPKLKKSYWEVCKPENFKDSAAVHFLLGNESWGKSIEKVADNYFRNRSLNGFLEHMKALIYQYPIVIEYYKKLENVALLFLKNQEYQLAQRVLHLEYELEQNAFNTKWLGQIELQEGNTNKAINFLEKSLMFNSNDEQVMYNLAGAYSMNEDYQKSYDLTMKLITRNPGHQGAQNLLIQLKNIIDKK
jgi:tetratricopeptide (TPR) repeat protein